MKIATWNLNHVRPGAGSRSQRLRDAIAAVAPDLLVLTESHPEFSPSAAYVRHAVSATAPDRKHGECWVAIWVRKEIAVSPLTVKGEPERSAAIRVDRDSGRPLIVFGTVLPWRGDRRHHEFRGGQAFVRSLQLQMADWIAARTALPDAALCVTGDFNQELAAIGPVGTQAGLTAFEKMLRDLELVCVTGGIHDPLVARGWRASIDHILISRGLRVDGAPEVWPEQFPLPKTLSDHHGVCVRLADD